MELLPKELTAESRGLMFCSKWQFPFKHLFDLNLSFVIKFGVPVWYTGLWELWEFLHQGYDKWYLLSLKPSLSAFIHVKKSLNPSKEVFYQLFCCPIGNIGPLTKRGGSLTHLMLITAHWTNLIWPEGHPEATYHCHNVVTTSDNCLSRRCQLVENESFTDVSCQCCGNAKKWRCSKVVAT